MFKYIASIILIGASVTIFLVYTKPIFSDIGNIKTEIVSYNEALNNAKSLENERDKLTKKYNTIDPNNLVKLQKFLPDNVDNIRLILEIEKIASPYGMVLKDVKYDSSLLNKKEDTTLKTKTTSKALVGTDIKETNKEYGTWNLEFSTEGTYSNFNSFIRDLEKNLRIVDISYITFSSDSDVVLGKPKPTDLYKYDFKIKTYWLKN